MRFMGWVLAAMLAMATPAMAREAAAPVAAPATAEQWRAAYDGDLDFLRDTMAANHPGAVDPANGDFAAWLVKGYAEAKARAPKVTDAVAYRYGLIAFVVGFHDSHTALSVQSALPPGRWPGFLVGRTAGGDKVILRDEADPAAPAVGSRIIDCDGAKLDVLAGRLVFPFRFDARIPENRRYAISSLFFSRQNPFAPLITACRVQAPGERKPRKLTLNWRPLADEAAFNAAYTRQLYGDPPKGYSLTEPAPGVVWVRVPRFSPQGPAVDELKAIIATLNKDGDRFRAGRLIVLDTRGNGGGNSQWGEEIAQAIWSGAALDKYWPATQTTVAWRASKGNADYLRAELPEMERQFGQEAVVWIETITKGMDAAMARGDPFFTEGGVVPGAPPPPVRAADRPTGPGLFPAKVIFLSDGGCASACLDFADRVLHMPGVIFAGSATNGDGLYMDGRDIPTPSGLASLFMAQKVYRGRLRGDVEVYQPDRPWAVDWRDEAAVRAWVLGLAPAP